MKLNNKFVRTLTCAAVVVGAAAMLSVGAFAAEADINDPTIAGYLPPQEQMVHSVSLAVVSVPTVSPALTFFWITVPLMGEVMV